MTEEEIRDEFVGRLEDLGRALSDRLSALETRMAQLGPTPEEAIAKLNTLQAEVSAANEQLHVFEAHLATLRQTADNHDQRLTNLAEHTGLSS